MDSVTEFGDSWRVPTDDGKEYDCDVAPTPPIQKCSKQSLEEANRVCSEILG